MERSPFHGDSPAGGFAGGASPLLLQAGIHLDYNAIGGVGTGVAEGLSIAKEVVHIIGG